MCIVPLEFPLSTHMMPTRLLSASKPPSRKESFEDYRLTRASTAIRRSFRRLVPLCVPNVAW